MRSGQRAVWLGKAVLVFIGLLATLGSVGQAEVASKTPNQLRGALVTEARGSEEPFDCNEWLRPGVVPVEARLPDALDIATLRDFGPTDGIFDSPPLVAISPSGETAAIALRRARPSRNDYCQGLFLIDLTGKKAPKLLDLGGDYIRERITMRSLQDFETGLAKPIVPSWSPDGRFLLYLRRDGAHAQVRVVPISGEHPYTATNIDADVTAARWLDQSRAIEIVTEQVSPDESAALRAEAANGYRYDERFWPIAFEKPFAKSPLVRRTYTIDLTNRVLRPTDGPTEDRAALAGVVSHRSASTGSYVSLALVAGGLKNTDVLTLKEGHAKHVFICTPPGCFRVIDTWFIPQRDAYYVLVNSGFAVSKYSFLEWRAGEDRPRTILETGDLIIGCQPWRDTLLCGVENATSPRKLERISLDGGPAQVVFDPNPEFARLRFGSVRRLFWRNSSGIETYADLVTPPDVRSGEKYPLVVVQYNSRGFLRGGTGDEYPIHAIAARGFVVLSFSRPLDLNFAMWRRGREPPSDYVRKWRDRKSVQSSLERGVALAMANGPVRADKLAITGLSDGATSAAFALINSDLFSTAILSTCCDDPTQWESGLGSTYRSERYRDGYPFPPERYRHFWRQGTLAMNPGRRCIPLLMQVADTEFRSAIPTFEAWRASGATVEMYVFPNESHIKWQPAHRMAIYSRNIDWLEKWRDDLLPRCATQLVRTEISRP